MRKNLNKRIMIFMIFLTVCLFISLVYYYFTRVNSNEYKALKYLKEFDKPQTYEYIGESKEECRWFVGCELEVYFEEKESGKEITVHIHNGKAGSIHYGKEIPSTPDDYWVKDQ